MYDGWSGRGGGGDWIAQVVKLGTLLFITLSIIYDLLVLIHITHIMYVYQRYVSQQYMKECFENCALSIRKVKYCIRH